MRNWPLADPSTYAHVFVHSFAVGAALFDEQDFRLLVANAAYQMLLGSSWHDEEARSTHLSEHVPLFMAADCLDLFRQVAQTRSPVHRQASAVELSTGALTSWDWTLTPLTDPLAGSLLLIVHKVAAPGPTQSHAPAAYPTLSQEAQERLQLPMVHEGSILSHAGYASMGMEEERHRWVAILDQLPEGVLVIEATTSIIRYANAMAMQLLGLPASQVLGFPLNRVASATSPGHFESFTRWNFALIRALSGETVPNCEVLVTRPDGSQTVMLSSVSPIRGIQGRITEAVMVFQDITAQKTLEQRKQEFFAVAHHELRTPLTAILGFAELLHTVEGDHRDQRRRDALERILQEGVRLRTLLHDLLDVSRLDYARLNIQLAPHDLFALVRELVEKYRMTERTHRFRLTLQDVSHLSELMGWIDRLRIAQVLENVLMNAVKYSPKGEEIEVGLCCLTGADGATLGVLIWVKDQGCGIAARDLTHIFERFYRGSKHDPSISGFGIGLFLAKEIVEAHGGHIWVESTLGQGSTFFVRLPLEQPL